MIDEEAIFAYLDRSHKSDTMCVFGAVRYLNEEFGLTYRAARGHINKWISTFPPRRPAERGKE